MAMIIVHTKESEQQTQADLPELQRQHKKAMAADAMWGMFGGVLTIQGRVYQVAEGGKDRGNQKHVRTRQH